MGRKEQRADRCTLGAPALLTRFWLYWHTIRNLRVSQIAWRIKPRLSIQKVDTSPAPSGRTRSGTWTTHFEHKALLIPPSKIILLNVEADISDISIWNNNQFDKLWLYNLNYFDFLISCNSQNRVVLHKQLIQRWINENPVGKGIGWEPYPTSRRIVNWIKWSMLYNESDDSVSQSIAVQTRWLLKNLEFHLLGNHLLANVKALLFSGLYFSGQEADSWYQRGEKILEAQLGEQVLPDGGHFELSPMYHLIVLEDLLDILQLHSIYEHKIPTYLHDVIQRMLSWSKVMRHPDGDIPFFNDATFKGAASPLALDDYARSLGYESSDPRERRSVLHLKDSGYLRIASEDLVLFADLASVGPDYLPGHAHADTLSFELSLCGKRVIVNGGTSLYKESSLRQRQRKTSSHNTVTIDNSDSSEVWGGFRVAQRARVQNVRISYGIPITVQGEHDGYKRLAGSPIHRRTWRINPKSIEVIDSLLGCGKHHILLNYNFPPWIRLSKNGFGEFLAFGEDNSILFRISLPMAQFVEMDVYLWGREFGVNESARRLRASGYSQLPTELRTLISW